MQLLTERQVATAHVHMSTGGEDAPANSPSVNTTYPVAGTPSHKRERGVNVSRQEFSPPSRLSLRARIAELEWRAWRSLTPQGKRNKITTSIYLMRCEKARGA